MSKQQRVKAPSRPVLSGKIPRDVVQKQAEEANKELVAFSFRFLEIKPKKFCPTLAGKTYLKPFIERLKAVCTMTVNDVRTTNREALRFHAIIWSETSEPKGFQNLPKDLKISEPCQMQISSNEHGRIHGFFIGSLFYLVWIDPSHFLYR